ncbi:uncharacterized protein LOC123699576 [Colias croceus]|uniref:uncharacterized protein LOC123699576 n=1 Tax=Colias crocea TaxID=72248 RepID=UPI001E27E6BA|nr:uncharacterized protein LOC123699576 [Colias croceus]
MLMVHNFVTITFMTIALDHVRSQERTTEHQGPVTCGGRLKGPVGTIQTPNFPNPFPVPLKCKWIIEHDIANGTISIYFTQQYTTSGLTFTEYMYYDDTYKLGERRALTVTEENITRIKYLQVQSPVLVVELSLSRAEGSQLRALGLLSVFGLNVTYAVRAPAAPAPTTSCSAIECRLLGHCYASHDYSEFYCSCFEGYSGSDCGIGPLCPSTSNMCKNGGTCGQLGPAAVSCICAPGYTGDLCESEIAAPECGLEECADACKKDKICDCNSRDTDVSSARFETRVKIVDHGINDISKEITKQMSGYLRASNITLHDDVEILNISSLESGARTAWVRVWGARRELGAVRSALARLAAARAPADPRAVRLVPDTSVLHTQPALTLHKLIVNQRPEVWEGSEFILSCMAYGSPNIGFTWYKDGVKVNFNGTNRDIWTRTVAEDALGRQLSVLGVSEAKKLDTGKWSCAADDAGRRRCSALRITVLKPPDIRLMPSTLTVNKGENVSITCLAGAGRVHGALGFSWARERSLLPLVPGRELWEDLYPAGSLLRLYNIQKSGEFRCQVSSVVGTNSKSITVWTIGPTDEACDSEASYGMRWPRTAPGAIAIASCPPGQTGESSRFCEPKTIQRSVKWNLPNFSGCISEALQEIYEQFILISYGYSWKLVHNIASQYGSVLRSLPALPGSASLPLQHTMHMLHYLRSSAAKRSDKIDSTEPLLQICASLLKHPDAFLDEEKIYDLQNAIVDAAAMKDKFDMQYQGFTVKAKVAKEDNAAHFNFPRQSGSEDWSLISVGVELLEGMGNVTVVAVLYEDLGIRLPSLRRIVEYKGGREMEFQMSSAQTQLSTSLDHLDASLQHTVTLLFVHNKNYTSIASKLSCALRTRAEPGSWVRNACDMRVTEPTHVSCRCRGLGTFALFTVARSSLTDTEKDLRGVVKLTVSLGGAMCFAAAVLQLLALAPAKKAHLPTLLKAVTAGTHSAALFTLLECDNGQEEACPGALGWVCAACWCAGCGALCAQPLLLQAELGARAQRAPSVGLVAGVCTLSWLTARLWGGAPLQLGSGAQVVCAAGCALLTILCIALTFCAALRLRIIMHKVPAERRTYLKDRSRVVRHTLVLAVSTSAVQAAAVAYAQPPDRRLTHVAVLGATALANGIAMFLCYVICDEECVRLARRAASLPSQHCSHRRTPDTALSLYIKQSGEVESCAGAESASSPLGTFRSPHLSHNTSSIYRRQSNPDNRADVVRFEYRTPDPRGSRVCDLIPHQQDYILTPVCVELDKRHPETPVITCPINFEPYTDKRFDTPKESCNICVQSNPDVSDITIQPFKSCLKKSRDLTSSVSLPSMEVAETSKSDIEQVNREWNKAYDCETNRVINKITNDLDFLLNRTQVRSHDEPPT